jgi:hypothetical protein
MNGDGVCKTERRLALRPGTTRMSVNLTGPRVSDPGDRERSFAVPNLDRNRGGLLDVREKSRGRDHVVRSTRVDDKNARDGFNSGDGCSIVCRAAPSHG